MERRLVHDDFTGLPKHLFLGTSSWSSPDWKGVFYGEGTAPGDFIAEYASRFSTVEIDATFYRSPSLKTVESWEKKTPPGFIFSAKVPQAITHEKGLVNCEEETRNFLQVMSRLGPKLGPLVFQFAYVPKRVNAAEYDRGAGFRRRLSAYLTRLPRDFRYAVEIRNGRWLDRDLIEILRENQTALVLTDYYTMPSLREIETKIDPVTANFSYVRFLGDRRRMEALLKRMMKEEGKRRQFDALVVDRTSQMEGWIPSLMRLAGRIPQLFVYFNNHYAGFAPGSAALFARIWRGGVCKLPTRDLPEFCGELELPAD